MTKYQKDLLERIVWTAVEAVLAVLAVHVTDAPIEWVPVLTAALAAAKGWVAKKIGDPTTAQLPLWVEKAVHDAATEVSKQVLDKDK